MRRILLLTAVLAAAGCARPPKPLDLQRIGGGNVLLVTIDTLRADALGCDGGPARTPAIDALAAAGLRFTFAHAHAVLTLPSHASILTGTYPFQHGVRDNAGYRLSARDNLATRLKAAGYATGAFIGAYPLDARFGLNTGFDVYDGRFDDRAMGAQFVVPERPAAAVVERASAWIRTQDRRWFAWVHVYDPHAPYAPPPPFDREYAGRPYFGEVAAVDRALAPLFDLARQSSRPTLIVLTGDHGEGLGDHGEATHGLFAYESTLRVPMIVAIVGSGGSGGSGASGGRVGNVVDAPVRHVDILPTILDVLDLPVPSGLPGHSLRTDADRRGGVDRPSYFEAMTAMLEYGGAPLDGIVAGREKLIRVPVPELYDLARDSAETQNHADESPERRRTLEARLAALGPAAPGPPRSEDAEAAARLRALGYTAPTRSKNARFDADDDPKRLVDMDRALHEAVSLGESGRLPEAIARYREVLARRPALTAASRHLAFAYWRTGNVAAAIATLQAALASAPDDSGVEVQLGAYLSETGRSADAIALLQSAAAAEPDVDTLNALGLACARAGRTRDALAAFERAQSLDPDDAATLANIGAVQLDAGRNDLARAAFEHAVRSNPSSAAAHAGLAMAAVRGGDTRTAIDEWKRTVELDASNFDALYDLGVQLARDNRIAEARPYLEEFARTAPAAAYAKELRNARAILRMRE